MLQIIYFFIIISLFLWNTILVRRPSVVFKCRFFCCSVLGLLHKPPVSRIVTGNNINLKVFLKSPYENIVHCLTSAFLLLQSACFYS